MRSTILFLCVAAAYLANAEFLPANDCKAIVFQPMVLAHDGSLLFSPDSAPFMFDWTLRQGQRVRSVRPGFWALDQAPPAMRELMRTGELKVKGERYFLSPTRCEDRYASNYGPLPGLMLTPPLVMLDWIHGDLRRDPAWLWHGAKVIGALLMAFSVLLLYWAARTWLEPARATWLAACYGLGSVAWSVASQAPCQQTFSLPWLCAGILGAARLKDHPRWALLCGLGLGIGTVIRQPLAWYGLMVGVWLAQRAVAAAREGRPRGAELGDLMRYAGAAVTPLVGMLVYNLWLFGSLSGFGQVQRASESWTAGDPWGTPLFTGLAGLLFSPGRGLFVYSPVLLFALLGGVRAFRDPRWTALRPLAMGAFGIVLTYSKWYSWWGGWSYGPRLLLDVLPVACLLLAPALPASGGASRWRRWRRWWPLQLAFALSLYASALGFLAFDVMGWNARKAFAAQSRDGLVSVHMSEQAARARATATGGEVREIQMDVDQPRYRYRLWSWSDSPLVYYTTHFEQARALRRRLMRASIDNAAH